MSNLFTQAKIAENWSWSPVSRKIEVFENELDLEFVF